MMFWPEQEREKSSDTFKGVWEAILRQTRGNPFIRSGLERANKLCLSLLEPTGPAGHFFKFQDKAEWQVFYAFLLERFVRTDEELKEALWRNTLKTIDPVRVELLKELTLPAVKVEKWLKKVDNAAQMIVATQRSRNIDRERKSGRITGVVQRFNRELEEIRGQSDGKS